MPEVCSRENSATPLSAVKKEKQSLNLKYANPGWSRLETGLGESPPFFFSFFLFCLHPQGNFNIDSPENQVLWMNCKHPSGWLPANQWSREERRCRERQKCAAANGHFCNQALLELARVILQSDKIKDTLHY